MPKITRLQQLLMALGLLALSLIGALDKSIDGFELTVFKAIYDLPAFLTPIFFGTTQLGSAYALFGLGLILFLKKRHRQALKILLTGSIAYCLTTLTKLLVSRPRPVWLIENITQRDVFATGLGYPSGHTAVATAMALIVRPYLPKKYRFIVPLWIIGVAFSRVYLGVHGPLDVVGGFAIGWAVATLVQLPNKFLKRKT